ncbi:MAG: glycoside hydrolase family 3 protein [Lachnospiraceae bacterium]
MNKYKFIKTICSLLLCICLVGCAMPGVTPDVYTPDESPEATATGEQQKGLSREEAVEAAAGYMKNMTVEEKAGQLFIVNLELLDQKNGNYYEWRRFTKRMKKSLDKYHIGGVILFSRNIAGRKQTEKLVTRLQENSSIPLFISVDEEGGDVARIANNKKMGTTVFQTMEEIGRTKDASYVYNMGETIGSEISSLGFNVDFAPVADVKTSELNLEIGTRSFGGEPDKVAEFTSAFVKGIQKQNVSATLKHFPGQGSSSGDTHIESVNIDSSIASLRKNDFVPFEAGIAAGADFVMVSHISVSKVTETAQPASMSNLVMDTILRDELGFQGVIITDAMDMASITDNYTSAEAAYGAVSGGADIVLMPLDLEMAYNEIINRINNGSISKERLDASVLRILTVKFMRGIMPAE